MPIQPELRDPAVVPGEEVLSEVLGDSYPAYTALLQTFSAKGITCEWRYYKDGNAWLCKAQYKKKTIVWVSAAKGFFRAVVYVPLKAEEPLYSLSISEETKDMIRKSAAIGKLKSCVFEIRSIQDLSGFTPVMDYKLTLK